MAVSRKKIVKTTVFVYSVMAAPCYAFLAKLIINGREMGMTMQARYGKNGNPRGRILFLECDGVLHALSGSAELTRRFVWSHVLEAALRPFPEVCIVLHGAARSSEDRAVLIRKMGALGQRVIGLAPPDLPSAPAIEAWLAGHPEVIDYCILDVERCAVPPGPGRVIVCDPDSGIGAEAPLAALRHWLSASTVGSLKLDLERERAA